MATRWERAAAGAARLLPTLAGLGAGTALTATSRYRGAALWPVWAALALALTGAAGVVFTQGLAQWRALPDGERRPPRETATVACVIALGAFVNGAAGVAADLRPAGWHGAALVGTAMIGAIPTICVAHAVWLAARSDRSDTAAGELTDWLLARRRLLRTLLTGLGALVALSTLALGAAVRVEAEMVTAHRLAQRDATPAEYVLIFGGAGSLLVAAVHAPAALALRQQARSLGARLFSFTGTDEPAVLLERAEQRSRFEHLLGAESGPFTDLQAGIVVLAPLLASAVTVWLPR